MNFSLIICTYQRPKALLTLLKSVKQQTLYPDEILVVDGSLDDHSKLVLEKDIFPNLKYYKVDDIDRGLTKQRNYGISKVNKNIDFICFLDDDIILEPTYFEKLLSTYIRYPEALGVGGYITNEVAWSISDGKQSKYWFYIEDWMRDEPKRFRVRRRFGLQPDTPPCYLPTFSHGRSVSFLPPSESIYEVEQFMGGVSSYRREVFDALTFSSYFEGYGLYEDADFCFRLARIGKLYVNTGARLEHHHEASGRPNQFTYGKMVLRNGWYIWRVRYPKPTLRAKLKWHLTAGLLTCLTFSGIFGKRKINAFTEGLGRFMGWWSLMFNKPKIQ
ncbi:glycosyltransferase family 2 protein [Formosa sp. S-31]|uniref:glycosyltransferase family 2 protein n=1 Tax=Formosa sp. S-31 TaxID=2790949 RepID=UPI003EB6AE02